MPPDSAPDVGYDHAGLDAEPRDHLTLLRRLECLAAHHVRDDRRPVHCVLVLVHLGPEATHAGIVETSTMFLATCLL